MDDKERVTLKCLDCGNEFTMSYGKYRRKTKDYHWRCKSCRYKHHSELVKEYWNNDKEERSKNIAKGVAKWHAELSQEEKNKINKKIGDANHIAWKSKSDEERGRISKLHCELGKQRWANMTPEQHTKYTNMFRSYYDSWYKNLSKKDKAEHVKNILIKSSGDNKLHQRFEYEFYSLFGDKYYLKSEYVEILNNHLHPWDYAIFKDNELIMLIDLDGAYFHADICDYNGIQSHETGDIDRRFTIPDGIKWFILYELKFDECFEYLSSIIDLSYNEFIEKRLREYRSMPFPYHEYTNMELLDSFNKLCRMNCEKYKQFRWYGLRIGDRMIYNFHRSIWDKKYQGIIPQTMYEDNIELHENLNKHMFLHNYLNKNKILQSVPHVPIVSAGEIKLIINDYLSEFDVIFDPYFNYSSVMLACIAMNKRYIGLCNDEIQQYECDIMLRFLSDNGIETNVHINESYTRYDCLLTCIYEHQNIDEIIAKYHCKKYIFIIMDKNNKLIIREGI